MKVEEFYKKQGLPEFDKFDRKVPQFTYYDLLEFANDYLKHETAVPKGMELFCSNCNKFTTYDKSLYGTIQLTKEYAKDITVCPNCMAHSVLSDVG